MKRIFVVLLIGLMLSTSFAVPVYANSGQRYWKGVDSTGAVVFDENCPIEVTKEVLTFDILEFPKTYYFGVKDYLAYTGKVTAEYTFYNPSDYTVTATLAFPFGTKPDYASETDYETQTHIPFADAYKYDITLNGETIDKEVRYTLKPFDSQFKWSEDVIRLSDSYIEDDFYSPTMTVTAYTYRVDIIEDGARYIGFDWNGGDGNSRIFFSRRVEFYEKKDGSGRFSMMVNKYDEVSVYVIGKPLSTPLEWKCYDDNDVENRDAVSGKVSMGKTITMTLEDFALANWNNKTGVSKVDWYNAVIGVFNAGGKDYPQYNFIATYSYSANMDTNIFMKNLMRWYQYEITIEPKSSVTNIVTAPMYPQIDVGYNPDIYNYTYYLSPASTWTSFGELEIIINTPFYITKNSIEGFTKTETGYTLKHSGLPEGELEFTLCTSENPIEPPKDTKLNIPIEAIIFFSIVGSVVILIGVTVFLIIRKKKTKKK